MAGEFIAGLPIEIEWRETPAAEIAQMRPISAQSGAGRALDERWPGAGRALAGRWTRAGRALDERWPGAGRALVGREPGAGQA
ncbi:hypothetical protein [Sorangium sp. So ce1151]|uniref:hypothetical protein n=1 Tax=Sorangium sp. So ce1151 TaxID=3133332 RepID=UPI003F5E6688